MIRTLDDWIAAARQRIPLWKNGLSWTGTAILTGLFTGAIGQPGEGTLAGTSTAAGVVPTDATAGCPPIRAFATGDQGYLARVAYGNQTQGVRLALYDMLWKGGAYAFNANTTLSAQPSYSSRIPDGDYSCTELFIEAVTAFTGNLSIAIGYTDQDGNTGATTGTYATGVAPAARRWIPIPLAAGDSGLRKVESVVATVSTVGTFNVLVARRLWSCFSYTANFLNVEGMFEVGMPEVFQDSALVLAGSGTGGSLGFAECTIDINSR